MADFDWNNKCIKNHLDRIIIADTYFYLSLWEIKSPYTLLDLDCATHAIKVEAYPDYPRRILSYSECKKGLMFVGYLPAENIDSQDFKDGLKRLILTFFFNHPEIIDAYNLYHPEERIR